DQRQRQGRAGHRRPGGAQPVVQLVVVVGYEDGLVALRAADERRDQREAHHVCPGETARPPHRVTFPWLPQAGGSIHTVEKRRAGCKENFFPPRKFLPWPDDLNGSTMDP